MLKNRQIKKIHITHAANVLLFIFTVVYWHRCIVVLILLHLQTHLHPTVLKINRKQTGGEGEGGFTGITNPPGCSRILSESCFSNGNISCPDSLWQLCTSRKPRVRTQSPCSVEKHKCGTEGVSGGRRGAVSCAEVCSDEGNHLIRFQAA